MRGVILKAEAGKVVPSSGGANSIFHVRWFLC